MIPAAENPQQRERFYIYMSAVSVTAPGGTAESVFQATSTSQGHAVHFDSGGTISRLPPAVTRAIAAKFPGAQLRGSNYFVNCTVVGQPGTVDFTFGKGASTIQVPYSDFIYRAGSDCILGVAASSSDKFVIGDTVLRAAYVVFDQDNGNLHLAQASSCASENILAIGTGADAVPSAPGSCTGGGGGSGSNSNANGNGNGGGDGTNTNGAAEKLETGIPVSIASCAVLLLAYLW
jgi:hypothetical protein